MSQHHEFLSMFTSKTSCYLGTFVNSKGAGVYGIFMPKMTKVDLTDTLLSNRYTIYQAYLDFLVILGIKKKCRPPLGKFIIIDYISSVVGKGKPVEKGNMLIMILIHTTARKKYLLMIQVTSYIHKISVKF